MGENIVKEMLRGILFLLWKQTVPFDLHYLFTSSVIFEKFNAILIFGLGLFFFLEGFWSFYLFTSF